MLTHDQMYNKSGVPQFLKLIIEFNWLRAQWDLNDAVFTIREQKDGYVSLKKLFVDHVVPDPSEATFAQVVFNDVGYWLRVRELKDLKPYIDAWRKEADVIRKSKAFKAMVEEVETNGKSAFSASKYLIEEPWKGRSAQARKTSKETTEKAAKSVKLDFMEQFLGEEKPH